MKKKTKNPRHTHKTHLIVESLEPRLVLSASGFAFGGVHDGPDVEPREHHDREASRPALIGARFDDHSPRDRDRHGSQGHFVAFQPRGVSFQPRGRDVHREARSDDNRFGNDFDDDVRELATAVVFVPPSQPASNTIRPLSEPSTGNGSASLFDELLIRQPTITVITIRPTIPTSLTSTTPSAFADLRTSLTVSTEGESTLTSTGQSVRPRLDNPPTIVPTAQAESRGTTIGRSQIESAFFDSSSLRQFEEVEQNNRALTFVSLSASQLLDWQPPQGMLDGAFASDIEVTARQPISHSQAFHEPLHQLEDHLASSIDGEGGLINIDFARDDFETRVDIAIEADPLSTTERTSTEALRDDVWQRFADRDFDFGAENEAADEFAELQDAEGQAADEESVAFDEGGMIVLTCTMIEDIASAQEPEVAETPTGEQVEILIEPAIGFFQAVEVATLSVAGPDSEPKAVARASEEALQTESAPPTSGQSAVHSDYGEPLSMRREAASTSMVLALAGFLVRARRDQKKDGQACDFYAC